MQKLGEWSYGIYIGQTFWLQYMRVIEFRFYPPPETPVFGIPFVDVAFWAEPILLMIVCTLWGGLLATKIETPVAKWLRRKLDRPRPAAPVSGII
jgi:peptidoglycan/LPS O-acetylase OafA/YrhL